MQRPCEEKRKKIVESAAKLFAQRQYHEVRLDDIAVDARVGKGTLYIYFQSKEDLFDHLLVSGFEQMVARVRHVTGDMSVSPWNAIARAVSELVDWSVNSPHFYQLLRYSDEKPPTPKLRACRNEFVAILTRALVRGTENGDFNDPHPELTAEFIPGCVRAALRFGPEGVDLETVKRHILRVIGGGIRNDSTSVDLGLLDASALKAAAMAQ